MGTNLSRKGYTLIELIICLAILCVLLGIVATIFIRVLYIYKKIGCLNELHYQAQVVNHHLYLRLSQCDHWDFDENSKQLSTYQLNPKNNQHDIYRIKHKSSTGDLIENYNELANFVKNMIFLQLPDSDCLYYEIIFEKGGETYILSNSIKMRNLQN